MKLENQVCTLEQGIKLFNYGIAGAAFNHVHTKDGKEKWIDHSSVFDERYVYIPAFTVAELGVMLPKEIRFNKTQKAHIRLSRFNTWTIYYNRNSSGTHVFFEESCNEAQARAAMLIYLLENNIITAEEVNNRLQSA